MTLAAAPEHGTIEASQIAQFQPSDRGHERGMLIGVKVVCVRTAERRKEWFGESARNDRNRVSSIRRH